MISIIIPCYNGIKYIDECLQSCIDQTYTDLEILIIDDGSEDGSRQRAIEWHEKHPDKITVWTKGNGGTASALNLGIEKMKGNWFKWLSVDDRLNYPDALLDMMKLISTIPKHEEYLYYTNFNLIDEDSKFVEKHLEPMRKDKTRDLRNAELMHNFYGNGSTSLIHKSLFEKVGTFDESLPYDEDLDFWMKVCIEYGHTLYFLPLTTLDYRTHKESLTWKSDAEENLKLVKSIRARYEKYLTQEQKDYIETLKKDIPLRRRLIPIKLRKKIVKIYKRGM